jgi:hypothetical protein
MNYAIEMVSDAMIYMPIFVRIGSCIQKLLGPIHMQTQQRDRISLLFFQNKESRPKWVKNSQGFQVLPEDGDRIQSPKRCGFLKNGQDDG